MAEMKRQVDTGVRKVSFWHLSYDLAGDRRNLEGDKYKGVEIFKENSRSLDYYRQRPGRHQLLGVSRPNHWARFHRMMWSVKTCCLTLLLPGYTFDLV